MNNTIKLVVAIILVILMIPAIGVVVVKDNMHNTAYCAACHTDYYLNYADPDVEYSLSHFHSEMGVSCQSCHQHTVGDAVSEVVNYITGNYYYPIPESSVPMDNCFACHDSYDYMIELTSPLITKAERNPHAGHFGDLECNECHNAHKDSEVYCNQCHVSYFEEPEPGWVSK